MPRREYGNSVGDYALRTAATREPSPKRSRPFGRVSAIASGPSERFVKLTRDPDLPRPWRFEPTSKQPDDIVI